MHTVIYSPRALLYTRLLRCKVESYSIWPGDAHFYFFIFWINLNLSYSHSFILILANWANALGPLNQLSLQLLVFTENNTEYTGSVETSCLEIPKEKSEGLWKLRLNNRAPKLATLFFLSNQVF